MTLRILIVDDHEVVRLGLSTLLDRHPGLTVVGEAATAKEAIQKTLIIKPDVVVMDIRLPGGSGIDACRKIIAQGLSVRQVEKLTSKAAKAAKPKPPKDPNIEIIEDDLRRTLGARVHVRTGANNRGKIEIEYYNLDDLERLLDLLRSTR